MKKKIIKFAFLPALLSTLPIFISCHKKEINDNNEQISFVDQLTKNYNEYLQKYNQDRETKTKEYEKRTIDKNTPFLSLEKVNYLSVTDKSKIKFDRSFAGESFYLIENGKKLKFEKGIGIHSLRGNKEQEIVYDLSNYNFDNFFTFYGLDARNNNKGDGITFVFSVSLDNKSYHVLHEDSNPKKGNDELSKINLNIKGYKYLKISVKSNQNINNDHGVLVNSLFYQKDYKTALSNKFGLELDLDKYDKFLANFDENSTLSNEDKVKYHKSIIVNRIEPFKLFEALEIDENILFALNYLFNEDNEALELYATGGEINDENSSDNWLNSLSSLGLLLRFHKSDLQINNKDTDTNVRLGLIYKKIIIALALNNPSKYKDWWNQEEINPYVRYNIFKKLHEENDEEEQKEYFEELKVKLNRSKKEDKALLELEQRIQNKSWHPKLDKNIFDNLDIEHMRMVMDARIFDQEIMWFNHYARKRSHFDGNFSKGGYDYVKYTKANAHDIYFKQYNLYNPNDSDAIKEFNKVDKLYNLSKFGIKNDGKFKGWVAVHVGQVCGGISKHGAGMCASVGRPARELGQPGHSAYFNYRPNNYWSLDNNIFGWSKTRYTLHGGRLMNNWVPRDLKHVNIEFAAPFLILAENVLMNKDDFDVSQFYVYLASRLEKKYSRNSVEWNKQISKYEKLLHKATVVSQLNYNAWYKLTTSYINSNKSDQDKKDLTKKIVIALQNYPIAYYYLSKVLIENINDQAIKSELNQFVLSFLHANLKLKESDMINANVSVDVAKNILNVDEAIATFSTKGKDAYKIIFNPKYEGSSNVYRISLDNKQSFIETRERIYTLNEDEKQKLNKSFGIYVGILGIDETFKIQIR